MLAAAVGLGISVDGVIEIIPVHDADLVVASVGEGTHDLEFQIDPLVIDPRQFEALPYFLINKG